MQTLVHHISTSRKPTVAILSHIVGVNAPTNSPFLPPPSGSRLAARWFFKGFSLTPYISVTLGNFPERFSLSDTTPQALPISLCSPTNSTSGLGVGPPEKYFLTPNYTKSGLTIWLIFGSLSRPRVPLRSPKFWENLTTGFSARWRQRFFFDPKYLANPWEFCKKNFTTLYPSPSSTNFPYLRYQFYFRFGGRAPEKKICDPQLYKIWSYDFAVFSHNDPSWGPLESPQIWLKSDDRILRNWEKTTFRTSFFSDFVTQS